MTSFISGSMVESSFKYYPVYTFISVRIAPECIVNLTYAKSKFSINVTNVCLFVLRLNVPVNNFSVMSGRSQLFLGLTNTVGS